MLILFVVMYFIGTLYLGYISYRKIHSTAQFLVANRDRGTLYIVGSLLATILGSSTIIGTVAWSNQIGWASTWMLLSASLGLFALYPFASRVRSLNKITLPQVIEEYYGVIPKKITSLIIVFAWVGIVAAQIVGAATIIDHLLHWQYSLSVILSSVVIISYTMLGGQYSILKTDLFQSLLIVIGLSLLAWVLYRSSIGLQPFRSFSSEFPFNISFSFFDLIVLLFTYSSTIAMGPDIFSRLFCAKNQRVAKTSVFVTALVLIPLAIIIGYIGKYGVLYSSPNSGELIPLILSTLPEWGVAVLIAALLSAVLSSADTTLLSAAIIVCDIQTIKNIENKGLKRVRWTIFIIGVFATVIALKLSVIIQILLIALSLYSGAFIVPLCLAIFRVPCFKHRVVVALIVGGVVALIGKIILLLGCASIYGNSMILLAFVLNLVIMLIPINKKADSK